MSRKFKPIYQILLKHRSLSFSSHSPFPVVSLYPLLNSRFFSSSRPTLSTLQTGVSELGAPWGNLVVLLQRLAATLATSSNHNSMELALLAVRNHVNDAILHAQLHGPRITATVSHQESVRFLGSLNCCTNC